MIVGKGGGRPAKGGDDLVRYREMRVDKGGIIHNEDTKGLTTIQRISRIGLQGFATGVMTDRRGKRGR